MFNPFRPITMFGRVSGPISAKYKVWDWMYFKARRDLRIEYVDVYTNVLEKKKQPKGTLEALEAQLDADDIIQYRKRAYAAVSAKPKPKGYFSSWFSSSSKSDEDTDKLDAAQEAAKLREFKRMMAAEDEVQVVSVGCSCVRRAACCVLRSVRCSRRFASVLSAFSASTTDLRTRAP